jgi:hypothetical protein
MWSRKMSLKARSGGEVRVKLCNAARCDRAVDSKKEM